MYRRAAPTAGRVITIAVERICLHDERTLGDGGVGVKPFDLAEVPRRLLGAAALELDLCALEDLLGRVVLERQ